ncbi:TBC1 domain family member 2A-like [Huso huso]|uniref:TBC1 domain family member 2A-like n=1 Tax=Huso huso TaxID=61971 RepID=A0ABR0ZRI6_HUSHU
MSGRLWEGYCFHQLLCFVLILTLNLSFVLQCAYLEAKNCQIESKYLVVLRRLQESKGLDSSQQEMVKRLIEDSLQGDKKDGFKLNPVSEYHDYGFKTIPDYEVEDGSSWPKSRPWRSIPTTCATMRWWTSLCGPGGLTTWPAAPLTSWLPPRS